VILPSSTRSVVLFHTLVRRTRLSIFRLPSHSHHFRKGGRRWQHPYFALSARKSIFVGTGEKLPFGMTLQDGAFRRHNPLALILALACAIFPPLLLSAHSADKQDPGRRLRVIRSQWTASFWSGETARFLECCLPSFHRNLQKGYVPQVRRGNSAKVQQASRYGSQERRLDSSADIERGLLSGVC